MSVQSSTFELATRSALRVGLLRSAARHPRTVESAIRAGLTEAGHHLHLAGRPRLRGVPVREIARELSNHDIAIVQYEFNSGHTRRGANLLAVLGAVRTPAIVVLHGIPSHPTRQMEDLVVNLCDSAALVVVMSGAAKHVLTRTCPVEECKVVVIPWGASTACAAGPSTLADGGLLTMGDLIPGLGAEHLIDAVAILHSKGIAVRCAISSQSPSKSPYGIEMGRRAREAGVEHLVTITEGGDDLGRLISCAAIVVLPYESDEMLVSPALVDSIAAGRPVIATSFHHARELLRDGAGLVVPPRNAVALAEAIRVATTDRVIMDAMTARARLLAPSVSWRRAQRAFAQRCTSLADQRERLAA